MDVSDGIDIDTTRWPRVVVEFRGTFGDEAFEGYLRDMDDILQRPGPRALVYDATHCGLLGASQRKMKTDWMELNKQRVADCTVGIAFVLPNSLLRGALTAIFWISPLPAPHAVLGSLTDAMVRCDQWLEEGVAGLSPE